MNRKATSRRRSTRRRASSSLTKRLHRRAVKFARWAGALMAAGVFIALFYYFGVSPYTLRWKALYGNLNTPKGYSIHGIDVSHHQGAIDWSRLAASDAGDGLISFVFIKATEGTSLLDENFNDNFYEAREHGFLRGAYHFYTPGVSAKKQAQHFLHQVHLEEGDLPPVLDIERTGNLSAAQIRRDALTWLQTVEERYHVPPVIYTNYKFKTQYLNSPDFEKYPYWIAHYYVQELAYQGEWKFWQYTDVGRLPGIKGNVDLNLYNGSMYDLRRLTLQDEDDR